MPTPKYDLTPLSSSLGVRALTFPANKERSLRTSVSRYNLLHKTHYSVKRADNCVVVMDTRNIIELCDVEGEAHSAEAIVTSIVEYNDLNLSRKEMDSVVTTLTPVFGAANIADVPSLCAVGVIIKYANTLPKSVTNSDGERVKASVKATLRDLLSTALYVVPEGASDKAIAAILAKKV